MNEPKNKKYLTRKQLAEVTNCRPYIVDYLRDCGVLPVFRPTSGSGTPVLYHHAAIAVVQEHLAKRQMPDSKS